MAVIRAVVVLCTLLLALPAAATTISFTAVLNDAPIQDTFPTLFPAGQTISGTLTFTDPPQTAPPYDVGAGAGVGEDLIAGTTISDIRGISAFSITIPGYGTVTGADGQVVAQNLATERFRIAAGGTFGGTVTGPDVPLTGGGGGTASLVSAFLEVESSNNLLSTQFVDDAAAALIVNLAGWDVRVDKQIRLSFRNPAVPNQTLEVDYRLSSVPEPTTGLLLGLGLASIGLAQRRIR